MSLSFQKTMWLVLILLLGVVALCVGQESSQTDIYGGTGGNSFSETMLQAGGRIVEVHVFSGDWVDAIQLWYELPEGKTIFGQRFGGPNGKESVFRLDRDEYIMGISGRYGDYLDSISIQTNKRTSPRFGGSGGRRDYRIDTQSGFQAVGIAGRGAKYLDAIGLIVAPIARRMDTQIYGGRGGSAFSDRDIPEGARISEIRIQSADVVDSVQFVYILRDGRTQEGPRHGGTGGRTSVFRLDRDEYITGITGRFGDYVDSLAFVTNRRTSQVFGGQGGRSDFQVTVPQGNRAVGLTGRAARFLDAVGLTYESSNSGNTRRDFIRRLPGRDRQ